METTSFGDGVKTYVGGLGDHKFSMDFQQDFAVSSVEQTNYPLLGTLTSVMVKALNQTTSSTNPAYEFTVLVDDWKPLDGKVGDLLTSSVSWPISGAVTKATS